LSRARALDRPDSFLALQAHLPSRIGLGGLRQL
jgi:hypothetical protein